MGVFENIPYTNFHDLNLDWIIKFAKEIKDKFPEIDELQQKADEILEKLEELDQYEERINTLIADAYVIIGSMRKPLSNVICLTDSYGTNDASADRYSWCDQLKDILGLDSSTYLKISQPGASFGDTDPNKNLCPIFVAATSALSDVRKALVSDILIVAGINEWNESNANMAANMRQLDTYIRANFPNANIRLFCVQWDKQANVRYYTMGVYQNSTYNLYRELATELQWHYVLNVSALVTKDVLVDDVHPNRAGSRRIAKIVHESVQGAPIVFNTGSIFPVTITTGSATRNAGGIYFDGTNFIWTASVFSCDAIGDIPSGFNGAVKLGTLACPLIIGVDYTNNPSPVAFPAKLGMKINNAWQEVDGTLSIRFINNSPELWFRNNMNLETIPSPGFTGIADTYVNFGSVTFPVWD